MHDLLAALALWPGRQATKLRLEQQGYWLPQHYKDIVLANVGDCDVAALDQYWDETAREYLCSAGQVSSVQRRFAGETAYRSDYLDALAASETNRNRKYPGMPLDPCLQTFSAKMSTPLEHGTLFGRKVSAPMEEFKRPEIERFGISAPDWTGTKGDFTTYLAKTAQDRGFVIKKKKWRKTFGALEFCCLIDGGMRKTWTFQLPLIFEIVAPSMPDLVFQTSRLDNLMPGFDYYHRYRSQESAILGIQAHVDLLDAIGELISTQTTSTV